MPARRHDPPAPNLPRAIRWPSMARAAVASAATYHSSQKERRRHCTGAAPEGERGSAIARSTHVRKTSSDISAAYARRSICDRSRATSSCRISDSGVIISIMCNPLRRVFLPPTACRGHRTRRVANRDTLPNARRMKMHTAGSVVFGNPHRMGLMSCPGTHGAPVLIRHAGI